MGLVVFFCYCDGIVLMVELTSDNNVLVGLSQLLGCLYQILDIFIKLQPSFGSHLVLIILIVQSLLAMKLSEDTTIVLKSLLLKSG